MFFGAAAISQGIEYCKRHVHTLGLRGEIGPAVTMARFVIAMARGERAIVAPGADDRSPSTMQPPASFDCEIIHVTTLEELVLGLRPYWGSGSRAAALRERARRIRDTGCGRCPASCAAAPIASSRQRTDTKAATRIA